MVKIGTSSSYRANVRNGSKGVAAALGGKRTLGCSSVGSRDPVRARNNGRRATDGRSLTYLEVTQR